MLMLSVCTMTYREVPSGTMAQRIAPGCVSPARPDGTEALSHTIGDNEAMSSSDREPQSHEARPPQQGAAQSSPASREPAAQQPDTARPQPKTSAAEPGPAGQPEVPAQPAQRQARTQQDTPHAQDGQQQDGHSEGGQSQWLAPGRPQPVGPPDSQATQEQAFQEAPAPPVTAGAGAATASGASPRTD